ncbi:MAG: peptide chain release factor 2, partial [Eggerthellaceae bacterium]|nr:peptide chain release factor 2 [Eggerthellaceae bacterium]
MEQKEFEKALKDARARLEDAYAYLNIEELEKDLKKLDEQIAKDGFWDDAQSATAVTKKAADIRDLIGSYGKASQLF